MSTDERAVLGDELQQRGDPQGELIALQLALEALPADAPRVRRSAIERRIAACLDAHHAAFYGVLAPHVTQMSRPDLLDPALEVRQWRGGFADVIWLQTTRAGPTLVDTLGSVRDLAIARFVRQLELGRGDHVAATAQLVRQPIASVRELVFGERSRWLPQLTHVELARSDALAPLLAGLAALRLGEALSYTPLASPTLRVLALHHHGPQWPEQSDRFQGDLPALKDLHATGFLADRELFARFPRLRRLVWFGAFEDGWLEHVVRSQRLARGSVLQLGYTLDDRDLAALVQHADALAPLAELDLRGNGRISDRAIAAARPYLPACVKLRGSP